MLSVRYGSLLFTFMFVYFSSVFNVLQEQREGKSLPQWKVPMLLYTLIIRCLKEGVSMTIECLVISDTVVCSLN